MEVDESKIYNDVIFEPLKKGNVVTYSFVWKPKSELQFSFVAQYDVNFTQLVDIGYLSRIVITVNGIGVFDGTVLSSPLIIFANDIINIRVYKNFLATGTFKLIGSTI